MSRPLLVALFLVASVTSYSLAVWLRKYRIDLKAHESFTRGDSPFVPINVLAARNYDADGRRRLWVLYSALLIQVAAILALIATV